MTNAELIKELRYCKASARCGVCEWYEYCKTRKRNNESCLEQLHDDAADALEAADKRIEELERNFSDVCNANGSLTCERNKLLNDVRELEARLPKEGEWIDGDTRQVTAICSVCGHLRLGNGAKWANMCVPFCEICGARMRGEHDEH